MVYIAAIMHKCKQMHQMHFLATSIILSHIPEEIHVKHE